MTLNKTCKTCEHESDKGQEYCGACDSITSNWSEAGWIKDRKIDRYESTLKRLLDLLNTDTEIDKIARDIINNSMKEETI